MFNELIKWSNANYSHLPWRKKRTPYTTLVSEIMLQQTTVGTVLNHFEKFIQKYPSIAKLAALSEEQILIEWKGLGYYRRAKNLLKAAKEIETVYKGCIPSDRDSLLSIKGIGEYTASAILAIGMDQRALAVDANLERVLARFYGLKVKKGPGLQKEIRTLFLQKKICSEIEELGPCAYNEALMDLGRSICKARSASCEICPLNIHCYAFNNNTPLGFPIQDEKRIKKFFDLKLLRLVVKRGSKVLVYKKNENEWLAGQYEIPTFILSSEDEKLSQYPKIKNNRKEYLSLKLIKSTITKYKIENYILKAKKGDFSQLSSHLYEWKELEGLNLSTTSLKVLADKVN